MSNNVQSQIAMLQKIGLDMTSSRVYLALCRSNHHGAGPLAKKLNIDRSNLYRVLKRLIEYGFIKKYECVGPSLYFALPLEQALANYHEYMRQQVREIIIDQRKLSTKSKA